MPGVALNGVTITPSTASNHITYRRWEQTGWGNWYCVDWDVDGNCIAEDRDPVYDWKYYQTDSTVVGTCSASSTGVFINGSNAVLNGDSTVENDEYTIPSGGEYYSGAHSGANGSVTSGNSKSVYINGRSVAVAGSSISTHAGTSSTIQVGSNNVFIGV